MGLPGALAERLCGQVSGGVLPCRDTGTRLVQQLQKTRLAWSLHPSGKQEARSGAGRQGVVSMRQEEESHFKPSSKAEAPKQS